RRLPEELQDAPPDGPAPGRDEADPRPRQSAGGPRPRGRETACARRGDHSLDDAARAGAAAPDPWLAATADRPRERHRRPARQPAARGSEADGQADEADAEREDAFPARIGDTGRAERRPSGHSQKDQEQAKEEEIQEVEAWQSS